MYNHAYQYKQALRWMERLLILLELALLATIIGAIITHQVAFIASAGGLLVVCLSLAWWIPISPSLQYTQKAYGEVRLDERCISRIQTTVQRIHRIQQFLSGCYLQPPIQRGSEAINIPELIEKKVYDGAREAHLCCPLSGKLMREPVYMVQDGLVVDRLSVDAWLAVSPICPFTKQVIMVGSLRRAHLMIQQIERFIERVQVATSRCQASSADEMQNIFCPISLEPMRDPVRLRRADRVVDSRSIQSLVYCPFTNTRLDKDGYVKDAKSRELIDALVNDNEQSLALLRRQESLQAESQDALGVSPQGLPNGSNVNLEEEYKALCCPLSGELMVNPITLGTGKDTVVDRDFILECMTINTICPLTQKTLDRSKFQEHTLTKERLANFKAHPGFPAFCAYMETDEVRRQQLKIREESLNCAISMSPLQDPVDLLTGTPQVMDRSTLEKMLKTGHDVCPFTRKKLPYDDADSYPAHASSRVKLNRLKAHPLYDKANSSQNTP